MRILVLTAILLAAACSKQANKTNGSNITLYATPGAPGQGPQFSLDPPRPKQVAVIDRARLVGRWANSPSDCGHPIGFREDGTYVPGGGARNGRWELVGDYLTLTGSPARDSHRILQIGSLDERRLMLLFLGQPSGELIRCDEGRR